MNRAPGTRLGSYDVVSLLGSGGTGEVARAIEPLTARVKAAGERL